MPKVTLVQDMPLSAISAIRRSAAKHSGQKTSLSVAELNHRVELMQQFRGGKVPIEKQIKALIKGYGLSPKTATAVDLYNSMLNIEQGAISKLEKISNIILPHTPQNKALKMPKISFEDAPPYCKIGIQDMTFEDYLLIRRKAIHEVDGTKLGTESLIKNAAQGIGKREGYFDNNGAPTNKWKDEITQLVKLYKLDGEAATGYDLLQKIMRREVDRTNFLRKSYNAMLRN